jgi:hypothetical protein
LKNQLLSEVCKTWGSEEWGSFDNPVFQARFQELPESEKRLVLTEKSIWELYNGNSNPISEGENPCPGDSYSEYLEETQKKQEQFIKERGDSMIIYHSFIEALEDMSDKEFRDCILALTNYGLYGEEADYKGVVKMYMTQAKPQIDANKRRRKTSRENGLKGGAPLDNNNALRDK